MDPITMIIIGIIAVLIIAAISIYNNLVRSRKEVDNGWAQIDVQLKRRCDLIPNLVETVKGYAAHEAETLEKVIAAKTELEAAAFQLKTAQAEARSALALAEAERAVIAAGNAPLMEKLGVDLSAVAEQAVQLEENGKTLLYFAKNKALVGLIAVADPVKDTSAEAVRELKELGCQVVILTGDNARTADAVCKAVGADYAIAQVLPQDKEAHLRALQDKGQVVAMVGDGINDAPALTRAEVGFAIGGGTDVAIESADVVLTGAQLTAVPQAIRLSRAVLRIIKQNLFWAFFYNAIGIPVAAGVLYPAFGITLSPMIGSAAMSLSSFCVVTNALRLNLFDPADPKRDKHRAEVVLPPVEEKSEEANA